jgi:hypothetical protein
MEVTMQKQRTPEVHYPGDGQDSLIATDCFVDFAGVERKQNRKMVFAVEPPTAPLTEALRMLDDLKKSGLKIERS